MDGNTPDRRLRKRYSCCNPGAEFGEAHPVGRKPLSWLSDASRTWSCAGRVEGKEPESRFCDITRVCSAGKAPAGNTCSVWSCVAMLPQGSQ